MFKVILLRRGDENDRRVLMLQASSDLLHIGSVRDRVDHRFRERVAPGGVGKLRKSRHAPRLTEELMTHVPVRRNKERVNCDILLLCLLNERAEVGSIESPTAGT